MGMSLKMFSATVLSSLVVAVVLGQDDGIRCGECIMEMHRFGGIIHGEAHVLADYLADNYCPTIEEEHRHMCTTMGACHPKHRAFTCDECVAGMEWIEAYLEDPIFQAEALLYLE